MNRTLYGLYIKNNLRLKRLKLREHLGLSENSKNKNRGFHLVYDYQVDECRLLD